MGGEGQNLIARQEHSTHETPAEIQGKIDDMMGNVNHAYWDGTHPNHSKAVEQMLELQRKLHPG